MKNTFYHGDCKLVMQHDIPPESVDLIYLDPPFYTGQIQRGTAKWNPAAMEISYEDSRKFWAEKGLHGRAPEWMKHIAKKNTERAAFTAYLYYMMERLELCEKVLKQTGSIYLHCDYNASHYLKMVMDEVFGEGNFRNEVIWHYISAPTSKQSFGRKHDAILFYSKSKNITLNVDAVRVPHSPSTKAQRTYKHDNGKVYVCNTNPLGKTLDDVWDIPLIAATSKERTGYPTQKPTALLERIILASSNEGDVVLDPFCGCGTTTIAAQKLNRRWIGIDINRAAYDATTGRETQLPFGMTGELATAHFVCRDLEEVKELNPYDFERWVNEYYGAARGSKDAGIDGITKDGIPIQTKTDKVSDRVVRRLRADAEMHPDIPQPVKHGIIVSQVGFDDNARATAYEILTKFGIEIELKTPEELLATKEH